MVEVAHVGAYRALRSLTLCIVLACAHRAQAQTAGAQAEVLFNQGIALMDAGKFADACATFDASDKLEPAISTLLNRADCRERNQQYATAWGLFLDAERKTRTATDAATQQLHQVAIDHAAKLEPRLSKLTVNVPEASRIDGLQILRGTESVDAGAWNHPLPVDGGNYTITARAPGHDDWATTIEVGAEGDTKVVDVPTLKRPAIVRPPTSPKRSVLPYVFGSASLVLLGTALVFELSAESTYDDAMKADLPRQQSLWESANTQRYVGEAFLVGGIACAGIAVWRFVRHRMVESSTQVTVVPTAAPDQAGVQVLGRF